MVVGLLQPLYIASHGPHRLALPSSGDGLFGLPYYDHKSLEHDDSDDLALFVTQSMDVRTLLRHPLPTASVDVFHPRSLIEDLIVLGGKSLETAHLISDMKSLVDWHCGKVHDARSLPELQNMEVTPNTTMISLVQLNFTLFSNPGDME